MEYYTKQTKEFSGVALAMKSKPREYIAEGRSLQLLKEKMKEKFNLSPEILDDLTEIQTQEWEIRRIARERESIRNVLAIGYESEELKKEIIGEKYPQYLGLIAKEYDFVNEHLPEGKVKRKLEQLCLLYEPVYSGNESGSL